MNKFSDYEKIMQVLDSKGINQTEGERLTGLGVGTIGKLLTRRKGKGKLHPDNATKFLRTFHVKKEWWETGKGEIFISDDEPQSMESGRESFKKNVDEGIKREMLDQLYKDLDNQARHLDKALDLVARLLPPTQSVKSVTTKDG